MASQDLCRRPPAPGPPVLSGGPPPASRRPLRAVAIAATALAVLALDACLPLGIAAAVPYVALVLLVSDCETARPVWPVAWAGTVLTGVGVLVSPGSVASVGVVLSNRALALFALWAVAATVVRGQQARAEARRKTALLEEMRFAVDESAIVAITDAKGIITHANDKFCEISGYAREELLGEDHRIVNSGVHDRAFWRQMWRTVRGGAVWRAEVCNRAKDGRLYWVDTIIVPLAGADGRPGRFMALRQDITARKLAEERLAERHALATIGEMAAVVAHEVRNPLAGIRGALQVLRRRMPADAPERQVLGDVLDRVGALNDKLEDLLRYARPNAIEPAPVDLGELARAVVRQVSDDPRWSDVRFDVRGGPEPVRGDADLLGAALLNVVLNAAQAGAGAVTVTVAGDAAGARIEVADDGPGIPAAVRARVFEPFVTTRHDGTGLGLAIVRRTVEAHGGAVALSSPEGGGARLTMDLPREPRRPTAAEAAPPPGRPPDAAWAAAASPPSLLADGRALLDLAIGHVAHEVRNPLAGIRGVLDNLRPGRVPAERQAQYLEAAVGSVDRIARVLDEALAGVGLRSEAPGAAELPEVIEACRQEVMPALAARRIRLDVTPADALPPVGAARDRLAHGLANLIRHAAESSPTDGRVRVEARAREDAVEVVVRWADHGGRPADGRPAVHPRVAEIGLLPALAERGLQADRARVEAGVDGSDATLTLRVPAASRPAPRVVGR